MEQNYLENQHRVESFLKFHKTQEEISKKGWNEPQEEIKQNIADSSPSRYLNGLFLNLNELLN